MRERQACPIERNEKLSQSVHAFLFSCDHDSPFLMFSFFLIILYRKQKSHGIRLPWPSLCRDKKAMGRSFGSPMAPLRAIAQLKGMGEPS
jgi:hypothetical protein